VNLSRPLGAALACSFALTLGLDPAAAQTPDNFRQLAPTAWLLVGASGNVVMVPDEQGVLLVDDERAANMDEMLAAARSVSPGPIRYVINTHWHLDHSGGNAGLAAAGAVIVAHRGVRTRLATDQYMAAYNRTVPASPEIALPTVVFDEALDIHFGGETVRLRHTSAAHTDGDSLVYLEKANVLHMGDVFFNGLFPFIDRSSGGSIQGLIRSVEVALSIADADTQVIPAHGDATTRAELVRYRDMLTDVRDRVQAGMTAGETLDQIRQRRPTAAYELGGDADRFVSAVYDSLANPTSSPAAPAPAN
jgi:cyclase